MEMRILQEFMYLSRDLNFTKTAQRCFISQSVLSRHIQKLEAELGVELFVRDKRGLRLTPYGEAFAKSCKAIDAEYVNALSVLDNMKGGFTDSLRIAYISPLQEGLIDEIYELQLKRHPEVKLELLATWEARAIMLLRQNKIDLTLCVTFEDPDPLEYSSLVLFKDNYVILLPEDHRLAKKKSLTFEDLSDETVFIPSSSDHPIQYAEITALASLYPEVNIRGVLNSKHDATALVVANRGISLIRQRIMQGKSLRSLKAIPLAEEELQYEMRAVWKNINYREPLVSFIEILKEMLDKYKVLTGD